jgi:hypothetical protein
MNLDEGQRRKVAEWIEEGAKLSEIQTRIGKEFNLSMTYMDVRFLIDDLKLKPKDIQPAAAATIAAGTPPAAPAAAPSPASASAPTTAANEQLIGGKVSVTVDHVARPGAIVSGRVKFSDGKGGAWLIDQMGRPGLVPDEQGYRPSQPDIAEFQTQLQDELAKMGF